MIDEAGSGGGYVTRGRAVELEQKIDQLRRDHGAEIEGLRARLDALLDFPLHLAQLQANASLTAVRDFRTYEPPNTPRQR